MSDAPICQVALPTPFGFRVLQETWRLEYPGQGFSFSPLRDSCSPLRGSLIGKKKKNLWDQGTARTPCNANREDENGGGDPQQILRSCAESLLTAVA